MKEITLFETAEAAASYIHDAFAKACEKGDIDPSGDRLYVDLDEDFYLQLCREHGEEAMEDDDAYFEFAVESSCYTTGRHDRDPIYNSEAYHFCIDDVEVLAGAELVPTAGEILDELRRRKWDEVIVE